MLLGATRLYDQQLDVIQGHYVDLPFQLLHRLASLESSRVRVDFHGNPLVPRDGEKGKLVPLLFLAPLPLSTTQSSL